MAARSEPFGSRSDFRAVVRNVLEDVYIQEAVECPRIEIGAASYHHPAIEGKFTAVDPVGDMRGQGCIGFDAGPFLPPLAEQSDIVSDTRPDVGNSPAEIWPNLAAPVAFPRYCIGKKLQLVTNVLKFAGSISGCRQGFACQRWWV